MEEPDNWGWEAQCQGRSDGWWRQRSGEDWERELRAVNIQSRDGRHEAMVMIRLSPDGLFDTMAIVLKALV